jgi:uncharacterized protein (TIGR03663 family)
MHADEAIQADKFGALLGNGHYPYDPREYHGPGLAYLAWIPALLTGRTSYQTLTETTVRIAPALAGIALVFSPLLLAGQGGSTAVTWASAMLATSPIMVYYSRYFIPEMPLALWTSLFLVSLVRRWWAMAGIAAALMIATKETAVLAFAAAGMSYALVFRPRLNCRATAFLITLVVGVSILLAAPWNWGILVQSADAYWRRGIEGGGHQHPWYGYVQWLAITEAPILILAAISIRTRKPVVRFLWWYAILLAALYSAIPYKTPWCAVSMVFPLALLAGTAAESLRGGWQWAAVAFLGTAAWAASVPFATDPRNPWVYAHTGSGVFTIRDRIGEVAAAAPEGDNLAIDIYTRENFWPLPWYLRRFPNTRWWREVPLQGTAPPVVLVSPALEPDLTRTLYEARPPGERELYMNLFPAYVELRPQIEVRGYVTKSLWDRK